jgi:hypothetical protein
LKCPEFQGWSEYITVASLRTPLELRNAEYKFGTEVGCPYGGVYLAEVSVIWKVPLYMCLYEATKINAYGMTESIHDEVCIELSMCAFSSLAC